MASTTFKSPYGTHKMTTFCSAQSGQNKQPIIVILHGNVGLGHPYGEQIESFATDLAGRGYLAAIPQYYSDDFPHIDDQDPERHVPTLSAAIESISGHPNADPNRLGLVGFSLGAGLAMAYIVSVGRGEVDALVDFYGPLPRNIRAGVAGFPPTAIFHNKLDQIVPFALSSELFCLLPSTVEHQAVCYAEDLDRYNHSFHPDGGAYLDSRGKAREWMMRHMPTGAAAI